MVFKNRHPYHHKLRSPKRKSKLKNGLILFCFFFIVVALLRHTLTLTEDRPPGLVLPKLTRERTPDKSGSPLPLPESGVYIAGIIMDASEINNFVWHSIITLNCHHNYAVHIVAKNGVEEAMIKRETVFKKIIQNTNEKLNQISTLEECAPFKIQNEDDLNDKNDGLNRIDKISKLRDYQRALLMPVFQTTIEGEVAKSKKEGIVIIVDLDLERLPLTGKIVKQVNKLQSKNSNYPYDAICAAGVTKARGNELWYYDTFSTVLLPDTFLYPLSRRLIPKFYEGEDRNLVRSNNQNGKVTQGDIMNYFKNEQNTVAGAVSVTSCFGGLALYKASSYFFETCQYQLQGVGIGDEKTSLNKDDPIMRYASKKEERPCEHVVFHDCMKRMKGDAFDIAVNGNLLLVWGKNKRNRR